MKVWTFSKNLGWSTEEAENITYSRSDIQVVADSRY